MIAQGTLQYLGRSLRVVFEWPNGTEYDDGTGVLRVGKKDDELTQFAKRRIESIVAELKRVDPEVLISPLSLAYHGYSVTLDRALNTFTGVWAILSLVGQVEWKEMPKWPPEPSPGEELSDRDQA